MNNKYRILVIEKDMNSFEALPLKQSGYQVVFAKNCKNGLMLFASHRPDLVILNRDITSDGGVEFISEIRENSTVPIIVLSESGEEEAVVEMLDCGAYDYITKPVRNAELMARIRAALRNSGYAPGKDTFCGRVYRAYELSVDYDSRRVLVNDKEVKLTRTEYNITALLSEYSGKIIDYATIIKMIWGFSDEGSYKKLHVNISNIRKKIGSFTDKEYIINTPGVGYRILSRE